MKQLFLILVIVLTFCKLEIKGQPTLEATEQLALIQVSVMDMQKKPRVHDDILFVGQQTNVSYRGKSDSSGKFELLLPEGQTYQVRIAGLVDDIEFEKLHIPLQDGIISGQFQICYQPAQSYTLHDVLFETAKASLKANSFAILQQVAAAMKAKPQLLLEIAGHTDAVGDEDFNQQLSENRAKTVVQYLVQQGVESDRLKAVGYGESQPIADNNSITGRTKNRRTEARILPSLD